MRRSPPRWAATVEPDAVLGGEIGELVRRTPRLDEVRGQQRVVDRLDAKRLRVVGDDAPSTRSGRGETTTSSVGGNGPATVVGRVAERARGLEKLAFTPGELRSRDGGPLGRGQGLVQLVDTLQERPELEAAEHLLELGPVGRRERRAGRVAVDVEVSPHRREHLRLPCLVRVLAERLRARRRQVVHVLEHAFHESNCWISWAAVLSPMPGNAGDRVGRVALEADEVRHLLRRTPSRAVTRSGV